MKLPWTCERCGTSNSHYGACVGSGLCRKINDTNRAMRKLLDLARQIRPDLPPDAELENKVVTISMSKDSMGVTVQQRSDKNG